ncbi:zinc finger, CCHC-type containing protein [Tanacetum coccineum]
MTTVMQVKDEGLRKTKGIAAALEHGFEKSNSQSEHIDEFPKLVGDLATIDTVISDEDQALILLTSLPSSYDNFVETLHNDGLYVRGRSGQRDMKQDKGSAWLKLQGRSSKLKCYICQSEEHLKKDCPKYNQKKSQGSFRNKDQGSYFRANGVYTIMYEEWSRQTFGCCSLVCPIFTLVEGNSLMSKYLVNRSPLSAIKFKTPIDMLRFFGWLASIKQGVLEPGKFKCIFLGYHEGIVDNKLSRLDDVTSKVVLYRNLGLNKSGEYKNTFIGSGVGTDSVHHMVALLKTEAGCMTFTYAWKEEAIWLRDSLRSQDRKKVSGGF